MRYESRLLIVMFFALWSALGCLAVAFAGGIFYPEYRNLIIFSFVVAMTLIVGAARGAL